VYSFAPYRVRALAEHRGQNEPPPMAIASRLRLMVNCSYNNPTKDKVTLSFVGLLCGDKSAARLPLACSRLPVQILDSEFDALMSRA